MSRWPENMRRFSDDRGRVIGSRFLLFIACIFVSLIIGKIVKGSAFEWAPWPVGLLGVGFLVAMFMVKPDRDTK